jgi:hypothetical protein
MCCSLVTLQTVILLQIMDTFQQITSFSFVNHPFEHLLKYHDLKGHCKTQFLVDEEVLKPP